MAKVSVVVPVYNCEKYLNKCLESISSQSYSDLEIILVDDGSTDSYHATVFSVLYQKPISVLTGKGERAKMSGRFETLKENLGLDGIFDCYDADKMFDVSYDNIQDKLKEARLASLAFIRDGLK